MRKAGIAAGIVALVALAYALAGYWLAPRYVLSALEQRAAGLGATLAVEEVRTGPFAFAVDLAGVELVRDGRRLAAARNIHVDLAWASLWGDAWTVEEAVIEAPYVEVARATDGTLNWPLPARQAEAGGSAKSRVRVQSLSVRDGALHLVEGSGERPIEATLQGLGIKAGPFTTFEGSEASYELAARLAAGGTLASQGSFSLEPLAARGSVNAVEVPLARLAQIALRDAGPVEGKASARATYAYDEGVLALGQVALEVDDASYAGIKLERVELNAPKVAVPVGPPVRVSGYARITQGSELRAQGTLVPAEKRAELQLEAKALPLALAGRFFPERLALRLVSGTLEASGGLRIDAQGKGALAVYEGSAAVRELRVEARGSDQLLFAWESAQTKELKLALQPTAVEVGELVLHAPEGRLVIDEKGRINLAEVLKAGGDEQGAGRFSASVRRLRVDEGVLHFADRSLETPFQATLTELSGVIAGFSTEPSEAALVQLAGRVQRYGAVRIRGTIDLDEPKSQADITAIFRNIDLAALTPYVVRFAGYRVRSGRVSAELRYRVRDARLVGQNNLTFQRIQLGEKVEREGVRDLPLDLAVALLTDAKGRINLDIPVTGNLNDPEFDFGGLVARALGNVVGKIVSAPFRALARLSGREAETLDEIRFPPGTAELPPPQEEIAADIARSLAERPQLAVQVRGGYDPEADAAALRRRVVRSEIARRAGLEAGGPLNFGDAKTLQAAERLYLGRIGNFLDLQKLRAEANGTERYGAALIERLAAAEPLREGVVEQLARGRAEAVRAALLTHGLGPERVVLEPPVAREAAKEGVATQLSLTTAVNGHVHFRRSMARLRYSACTSGRYLFSGEGVLTCSRAT